MLIVATGKGFTVIVICSEVTAGHPPDAGNVVPVAVTVYVVVEFGVAIGFEIFVLLNPTAGDHE